MEEAEHVAPPQPLSDLDCSGHLPCRCRDEQEEILLQGGAILGLGTEIELTSVEKIFAVQNWRISGPNPARPSKDPDGAARRVGLVGAEADRAAAGTQASSSPYSMQAQQLVQH